MLKDKFDIDIEEALDGKFAVEMFEEALQNPCRCPNRVYRLILMDLSMPIMSGQDASRRILELQGEQDLTRIVALTAFTNEKTYEECAAIGI
jgi:CheY-like chemotaxis protein